MSEPTFTVLRCDLCSRRIRLEAHRVRGVDCNCPRSELCEVEVGADELLPIDVERFAGDWDAEQLAAALEELGDEALPGLARALGAHEPTRRIA